MRGARWRLRISGEHVVYIDYHWMKGNEEEGTKQREDIKRGAYLMNVVL